MLIEINGKVNWESELRLMSVHHEPPHTDMLKKGASSVAFLIPSHSSTRDKHEKHVTGVKEEKNQTVAQESEEEKKRIFCCLRVTLSLKRTVCTVRG